MTNEQFYILRFAERENLARALEEAERLMPEDAPRGRDHKFGLTPRCNFGTGPCEDHHYEPGQFLALEPFEATLKTMDAELELLKK